MAVQNLPDPHNPLGFVAFVEARLEVLEDHVRELRAALHGYAAGVSDTVGRQVTEPEREGGA
jgi:hypothetical protein